ncbi:MAG TPA: hypothetical protein PKH68_01330 [Paludibacteraceae bacterium]|nr:hypothetical protein [Paludibacteraceae bacterium]
MAKQPVTIEFTGTENIQEIFNKLPEQYAKKPVQAAFRKAAKPFIAAVRSNLPSRLSSLQKIINVVNNKSAGITAGVLSKKAMVTLKDKREYDAFFPVYWSNYGTYSRRDASHKFTQKRKAKTANRKGGIVPLRFVEKSWDQTKAQVEEIAQRELITQTDKFLKKHAIN